MMLEAPKVSYVTMQRMNETRTHQSGWNQTTTTANKLVWQGRLYEHLKQNNDFLQLARQPLLVLVASNFHSITYPNVFQLSSFIPEPPFETVSFEYGNFRVCNRMSWETGLFPRDFLDPVK